MGTTSTLHTIHGKNYSILPIFFVVVFLIKKLAQKVMKHPPLLPFVLCYDL